MNRKAAALAALVVATWSFPGVLVHLMPQLNPWAIAVFRLALGFVATLPVVLLPRHRRCFLDALREPVCWAVSSLMFAYYLAATAAFQHAPVGVVALIISASPAVALPIRLAFGTKPTRDELLGTVLALAGVGCVLSPGGAHSAYPQPILGPVFAFASALCAAMFTVSVGKMTESRRPGSPLALAAMSQGMGLIALPLALSLTPAYQVLDHRTLWALPLGFFCTALPTAGYAAVAGRLSPLVATMLNPMVAVSANAVAAIAIGEVPRIWVLPGGALIVAGISFAARRKSGSS